ncbi:MAG TPA: PIN domain-containing protein [Polyangiaceae bacterium]|nr:PIN domain-containing protein [Polyangiaceae bacterium]
MTSVLIDTGPLVASIVRRDQHHGWVRDVLDTVEPPLLTCEAVISEACFLLRDFPNGQAAVLSLLSRGIVRCNFRLHSEIDGVRALMHKFADVPMSLADACLVRMSELEANSTVLTFDSDFRIYRRNKRQLVPTIMPGRRGAS